MKKKIYSIAVLIVFTFSCATLSAQTEFDINGNGRPYVTIFDSLSTGLIASRIPYGTLYDRVYGWSGLSSWNNGDTTSSARLFQAWSDAEQSVMSAATRPNNYPAMRTTVKQDVFANTLPIIAVNFQFGYFDSTCAQDGRITVTNGLMKDNNRASPYLTKQVTIAGIGIDSVFANTNYSLLYNSSLLLSNTSTTIQNISFNNITSGTQKIFTSGAAQTVQFTQPGNNVLKFTVKLSNGSSFITTQIVKVKIFDEGGTYSAKSIVVSPYLLEGPSCPPTNQLLTSDIPFKGYGETQAINSYADYHIFYHATNSSGTACEQVLRKPIIILDGFDPEDKRDYLTLYNT